MGAVEGHDLERRPVVEDLDERAQQLGRLGEQRDALELARHHQPASPARLDAGQEAVGNGRAPLEPRRLRHVRYRATDILGGAGLAISLG
jgi:hypothetical protein